jgi:hypothetical protein
VPGGFEEATVVGFVELCHVKLDPNRLPAIKVPLER